MWPLPTFSTYLKVSTVLRVAIGYWFSDSGKRARSFGQFTCSIAFCLLVKIFPIYHKFQAGSHSLINNNILWVLWAKVQPEPSGHALALLISSIKIMNTWFLTKKRGSTNVLIRDEFGVTHFFGFAPTRAAVSLPAQLTRGPTNQHCKSSVTQVPPCSDRQQNNMP